MKDWSISAVRPSGAPPRRAELEAFARLSQGLAVPPGFLKGRLASERDRLEAVFGIDLSEVRWSPSAVADAAMRLSDELSDDLSVAHAFFMAATEAGLCMSGGGPKRAVH